MFSDVCKVDIAKITMVELRLMSSAPIHFYGAVNAFKEMSDDFKTFVTKVKESQASKPKASAKQKASPLKRVTDGLTQTSSDKAGVALKSLFHKTPQATELLLIEPAETPTAWVTMTGLDALKSACAPAFWAAGHHTTQTTAEANFVGSLRVNFHGTRQWAAVDFGMWCNFCRRTKTEDHDMPPEGEEDKAECSWSNDNDVAEEELHAASVMKTRFRDLCLVPVAHLQMS